MRNWYKAPAKGKKEMQVGKKTHRLNIYGVHFFKFLQMIGSIWIEDAANEAVYLSKIRQNCKKKKSYESLAKCLSIMNYEL